MSATQNEFSALFAPEPDASSVPLSGPAWKVLLVDDEADIHAVLHLAMQDMRVEGRPLQLFDARSTEQAKVLLAEHPDMALILLDVVMESEQAGLMLVRHIRRELGKREAQIVLVTGQPGYAPQREVVMDYEIDGYRLKSELTADKIFVSVYSALRTYKALRELATKREELENLANTLREGEDRLRSVIDTAPDAIVLADEFGAIVGWNEGAHHMFGYTQEEVLGQSLNLIIPPRYRMPHMTAMERNLTGQPPVLLGCPVELEALHKAGGEFSVELVLGSWITPTGRHFSAVIRDITERKKNEAELQHYRHHLEQLVAASALVLKRNDLDLLRRFAEHGPSLGRAGVAAPLVMTSSFIDGAQDSFPLELIEIHQARVTLAGRDCFETLVVQDEHVRLQCERELRRVKIRMRQGLLTAAGHEDSLAELQLDIGAHLLRTLRGMLWLRGTRTIQPRDAVVEACERFAGRAMPGVRGAMRPGGEHGWTEFKSLYADVEFLVNAADAV